MVYGAKPLCSRGVPAARGPCIVTTVSGVWWFCIVLWFGLFHILLSFLLACLFGPCVFTPTPTCSCLAWFLSRKQFRVPLPHLGNQSHGANPLFVHVWLVGTVRCSFALGCVLWARRGVVTFCGCDVCVRCTPK